MRAPRVSIGPWRSTIVIVAGAALVWLYVGVILLGVLQNVALLPVWVVLGSITVPASILVPLAHRAHSGGDYSSPYLLLTATAGGLLAIVVGGTIDALVRPAQPAGVLDDRMLLLAGFIEEACKLAVILLFGRKLRTKSMTDGLILGTAVGLGFAAFEDMGYAMEPFLNHSFSTTLLVQSAQEQLQRQIFTPFGHPLWSALLGAAVFAATQSGRFRFRWAIVFTYLGVAVAHGAWDGAAALGTSVLGQSGAVAADVLIGLITAVEIYILIRMLRASPRPDRRPSAPEM
jgi:RsiW-degrading membrane proteinase PrsW (M82 family)